MSRKSISELLKMIWSFLPEICITIAIVILLGNISFDLVKHGGTGSMYISLIFTSFLLSGIIGQFFWKNLIVSLVYSVLFGFGSIFMVMAVLSEYYEFPAGDPDGILLLTVGLILFGGLALLSFIMPWKYLRIFTPKQEW